MSVARLHTVQKSKKDHGKCGRCGDPLPAGSAYRYADIGFRGYGGHVVRCMKAICTPKPSELESSLLADIYSAQEDAATTLDSLEAGDDRDVQEVRDAVAVVAEAIDTVAQQYRDQDDAFGGSGATEAAQRADTLEGHDLGGWDPSDDQPPEGGCTDHEAALDPECDDCRDLLREWWEGIIQEARDAIDEVELP